MLLVAGTRLMVGGRKTYFSRESRNTKNQVQLRNGVLVLYARRIIHVVRVNLQNCRSVYHWEQWSPFLEENVDHVI